MITYRYDAYGNTTKSNNTLNNPYQYNAEYTDSSTGLQYLRARYYDSSQGRFTTKDTYLGTIPNPLSRNLYTYVENNPLNYIDPSGHAPLRTDPMRNMPLISPVDQMKIDNQIAKQSFHPLDGINAATHPGGPKAYYDEKIENVYGEHFFGKGYSNPTGPYRLKTDSSLGHVSSKTEAKTKLQKAIDDRKINLYKTYCENGAQKAKDDGSTKKVNVNSITDEAKAQFLIDIQSPYAQDYLDRANIYVNEYGVVEIKYFDNEAVPYTYYYGSTSNLKTMSRQKANTSYHFATGGNLDKIGDNGLNNPDGSFKDPMWKAMYDLAYGDYSNNDWNYADLTSAVDEALPPLETIAVNTVIGFVVIKDYKSNMHIVEEIDNVSTDKKYAGILIVGY
ncbi:MAG: RHS repeat-associated core domain-containing protein [Eubacterium sp.]|nr:RHS repeat-associated core domain-containing protein [Eubacterium sp.]